MEQDNTSEGSKLSMQDKPLNETASNTNAQHPNDKGSQQTKKRPVVVEEPRLKQSLKFWFTPVDSAFEWYQQYGDAYSFHPIASQAIDFLAHPRYIKSIVGQHSNFQTGEGNAKLGGFDSVFGKKSTVVLDGDEHEKRRDWIKDALELEKVLPALNAARVDVNEHLATWQPGQPMELYSEMRTLATQLMCKVVLGMQGEPMKIMANELAELLETAITPQSWLIHHKAKLAIIDKMLYSNIAAKRATPGDDVLSRLIQAPETWVTAEDIHDNILTLVVLGHEGASVTTAWALYHIASDPAALEYIMQDVTYIAESDQLTQEKLNNTHHLDALIRETLRLHSPLIAIQRMATCPVKVGEFDVDAGQIVCPSMYLIHHNKEVWGDQAGEFQFDRFEQIKRPDPTMFLPFGIAPRFCPGQHIGYAEIKILLSDILYKFGKRIKPASNWQPLTRRRGNLLTPYENMPFILN